MRMSEHYHFFPPFPFPDHLGVLESVKAAADLCSPIGGTVAEINTSLEASPDLINKDPYKLGQSCLSFRTGG